MIYYPEEIERKIGFATIRELLEEACLSPLGRQYVSRIKPTDDAAQLEKLLHQTNEFLTILSNDISFPESNYLDVSGLLKKAAVENIFLTEEEFYDLKVSLTTIFKCLRFFRKYADDYPYLTVASAGIVLEESLIQSIEAIIDERGKVRDNASMELSRIRKEIVKRQSQARKSIESILRQARQSGFTKDDASITVRGGRLVIPISAEFKRRVKGFVHDESATGQTVFMEPAEVLEINNEIRELSYKENREVVRILTILTDELRLYLPDLGRAYHFLGMVDFIRAKAKLAQQLDACLPEMDDKPVIDWKNARHPLLFLSHKKLDKSVVPLSIRLDEENRILLISGPNAGGKSVCLKTVGLVQYMYQCGMLPPVDESSTFGLFKKMFIDIGDEQSIENDLSTYSSHLTYMREFAECMTGKTLFLIDEFGTGTEPQFGGAIAESILKTLNHKRGYGVITTHYANLKKLAEKSRGIINGAMRYDVERLEPLYELEIGKPGSSFALEIAAKIGLKKEILEHAKKLVGHSHVRFDELINTLEKERNEYKEQFETVQGQQEQLETEIRKYSDLKEAIDRDRKKMLKDARLAAKGIIEDANRRVESTIREIKEQNAEKAATKKVRESLDSHKKRIEKKLRKDKMGNVVKGADSGELAVGDIVRMIGQEVSGEIIEIKGKKAQVSFGLIKSFVKLEQLQKMQGGKMPTRSSKPSIKGLDLNRKVADFSSNLDLRGKRVEEALGEVDAFIDQAILVGYNQLRIVHGKGHGVLRDVVQNHLKGNHYIEQVGDEHIERGGSGVTVV
ncbi:MAG: endonuclease MutS2, partial [Bacteroidota bacterium]